MRSGRRKKNEVRGTALPKFRAALKASRWTEISDNGRPQPGVAIPGEMADVVRRHEDLITGLTDCGGTGRQDDVGVKGVRRSGGNALLAGICPKENSRIVSTTL